MKSTRVSPRTSLLRLFIAAILLIPLIGPEGSGQAAKPATDRNFPIIDYDGDGRSDISVLSWKDRVLHRKDLPDFHFNHRSEFPLPLLADFNGDGKTEIAYFDRGYWRIFGHRLTNAGLKGDLPVPADYDGDGRTDPATWRPADGLWSFQSLPPRRWGEPDDVPVPMDYDGDGKADIAVWRPAEGNWYIHFSSGQEAVVQCGGEGDFPIPADYDGDGKADIAVWRPAEGNWYVLNAANELTVAIWGEHGDIPVPGDYDGDGKVDFAVWRPREGLWYIKDQENVGFGQPDDLPLAWNIWILWAKKVFERTKENEDNEGRKEVGGTESLKKGG